MQKAYLNLCLCSLYTCPTATHVYTFLFSNYLFQDLVFIKKLQILFLIEKSKRNHIGDIMKVFTIFNIQIKNID